MREAESGKITGEGDFLPGYSSSTEKDVIYFLEGAEAIAEKSAGSDCAVLNGWEQSVDR